MKNENFKQKFFSLLSCQYNRLFLINSFGFSLELLFWKSNILLSEKNNKIHKNLLILNDFKFFSFLSVWPFYFIRFFSNQNFGGKLFKADLKSTGGSLWWICIRPGKFSDGTDRWGYQSERQEGLLKRFDYQR